MKWVLRKEEIPAVDIKAKFGGKNKLKIDWKEEPLGVMRFCPCLLGSLRYHEGDGGENLT